MLEGIQVLCHSSIRIKREKVIYIDPFRIQEEYHDADIILITHDHYDHYSEEDIDKIKKENTIIVVPEQLLEKVIKLGFEKDTIMIVKPNEKYEIEGLQIETIPAYNVNKPFHPKQNGWVGYILVIEGIRYYIAGDTDITQENQNVKCDVAFVPVGGTYTMDSKEAAKLANHILPKMAVPRHYGEIVGTKQDAIDFANLLDSEIACKILI